MMRDNQPPEGVEGWSWCQRHDGCRVQWYADGSSECDTEVLRGQRTEMERTEGWGYGQPPPVQVEGGGEARGHE